MKEKSDICSICGCRLKRGGNDYAKQTPDGRSHVTKHHYIAKRFKNIPEISLPKSKESKPCGEFCYECHEVLLHNPILLAEDVKGFADLVKRKGFSENQKTDSKKKIAGRIILFHDVIERGLKELLKAGNKA